MNGALRHAQDELCRQSQICVTFAGNKKTAGETEHEVVSRIGSQPVGI